MVHHVIRVYPRVCGGTGGDHGRFEVVGGLSPRVRGNPGAGALQGAGIGSIPACAGEPARRKRRRLWDAVYPRVCGGTSPTPLKVPAWGGLSPRVRGNLCRAYPRPAQQGSIPACAGEPRNQSGNA